MSTATTTTESAPREAALSRPAVRIGLFATAAVAVFGIAFGVGQVVGPWDTGAGNGGEHPAVSVEHGPSGGSNSGEVSHDSH